MKLTKKLEAEVRKLYEAFWDSYINGDLKTYASLLDADFKFIGSTEAEPLLNKKDSIKFLEATAEQLRGKAEFRNRNIKVETVDDLILITELCDGYILIGSEWNFYSRFRLSSLLKKKKEDWMFIHQHISMPDSKAQEGESYGLEQIRTENIQLRDAVKRRTVELENKNRELEIETALERVRVVAMGMKKPHDLLGICEILFKEFQALGFKELRNAMVNIYIDNKEFYLNYDFSNDVGASITKMFYHSHPIIENYLKQIRKTNDAFAELIITGNELEDWKKYRESIGGLPDIKLQNSSSLYYYWYSIGAGAVGISNFKPVTDEQLEILKRFRNVFDLAYKRYTDITKAEAQTREAQIELALERVRARAMAMHNSNELAELVSTVFNELTQLDFKLTSCIIWIHDHENIKNTLWIASTEINKPAEPFLVNPFHNDFFRSINHAWRSKDTKWVYTFTGKEKKNFEKAFFKEIPQLPIPLKNALKVPKQVVFSASFNNFGALEIVETEALTEEKFEILHRFGKVFDSSYTRFNDLQKAEAQAREAKIEAALEKVRSRTMAMQRSDELTDVAGLLFEQVSAMGIKTWTAGFNVWSEDNNSYVDYITSPQGGFIEPYTVYTDTAEALTDISNARKSGVEFDVQYVEGEKIKQLYLALTKLDEKQYEIMLQDGVRFPSHQYEHFVFGSKVSLMFITYEPVPEAHDIFKRLGKVFEQTYTRFLDLKKAEAQAREAQIEAALEKVRGRAMAMHKSEELLEAGALLYAELSKLGIEKLTSGYMLIDEDEKMGWNYGVNPINGQIIPKPVGVPLTETKEIRTILAAWKKQEPIHVKHLDPEETIIHQSYMADHAINFPISKEKLLSITPERLVIHTFNFKHGYLIIVRGEVLSAEQQEMVVRFAKVFEMTYRRFLDLQKAEAQAREAQIETGLERVRSKTMAMHKSEEVTGIAVSLNEELLKLGFDGGSTIMIIDKETGDTEQWTGFSEDKNLKSCYVPYFKHPYHDALLDDWKREEKFLVYTLTGEEKKTIDEYYFATGYKDFPESDKKWMREMRTVTFSHAFMKYGAIHWGPDHLTEEQLKILQRFSKVFEQSYTRFLDLQKAEAQAREAKIEAALERTRTQSMLMQHSKELDDSLRVFHEQVLLLGINSEFSYLWLPDEDKDRHIFWAAWAENLPTSQRGKNSSKVFKSKALNYPLDRNEPATKKCLVDWKSDEPVHSYYLPPGEVENYFINWKELLDGVERLNPKYFPGGLNYVEAFMKYGCFGVMIESELSEEEKKILYRFAIEFEPTYTRFLDLQKAEAQAREAQIEAALERVRSRSMAMHKSDDLHEVIKVVTEQLSVLGLKFNVANFAKIDPDGSWDIWLSTPDQTYPALIHVPYLNHPLFNDIIELIAKNKDFYTGVYTREEANIFFHHFFENTIAKNTPEERKQFLYRSEGFARSIFLTKNIWFSVARYDAIPFIDEENAIFKRFANVFEQAYTRFLDLQKAEAQAREADIELSLERVRAKTMAMQKPSEFGDVINIIGAQFVHLGFDIDWVNFGASGFAISEGIDIWNFAVIPGASPISARVFIPYFDHPVFTTSAATINEFTNGGKDFVTVTLDKQTKDKWLDHLFTKTIFKDVPEEYRVIQYAKSGYTTSNISLKDTWLSIGKFDIKNFTDEQHAIFRRFANAFGQAYTRFLDLQKAEAQAREAQIEASLERVRSRAMAMQNSDELKELIGTVFTELTKLDIVLTRCLIMIYDPRSNDSIWWMANSEAPTEPIGLRIQNHEHPPYAAYLKAWQEKKLNWVYVLEGAVKKDWDDFLFVETELSHLPDFVIAGMKAPERVYLNSSFNSFGNLTLATLEPLSNEHFDILLRFAKVFDLTYTRFNDLKQAEAQSKEAKIETALERVRSRSMAMQSPQELKDVALELRNQLGLLEQPELEVCAIQLYEESPDYFEAWAAVRPPGDEGKIIQVQAQFPKKGVKIVDEMFRQYESGIQDYVLINEGEKVPEWLNVLKEHTPEGYEMVIQSLQGRRPEDTRAYWSMADFKGGSLVMTTYIPPSDDARKLLRRFANVFGLAYRRFIDLKNAEIQKREAQIELALERVRARTMAMHQSDELAETAQVLFQQLCELGGIPDRIAIGIADEEEGVVNYWTTDQSGRHIDKRFKARLSERTVLSKTYKSWKDQKRSLVVDLHGDDVIEWVKFAREEMGVIVKDEFIKDRRVHSFAFFSHGWILVTTHEPQSAETIQILERFASVFNLTYRRFLDLQKAEAQANEARIEIALERIRARALAMHKSDELMEVAKVLREQMALLGQPELEASVVHLYEEDPDHILSWRAFRPSDSHSKIAYGHMSIPKNSCEFVREWLTKFYSEEKEYTIELSGVKQEEWYDLFFKLAPDVINSMLKEKSIHEKRYYQFSKFSGGALLMVSKQEPSLEVIYLQKRAAVVFDLAFRRFSDLQKTEAQAREAQIEVSLERVRAKAMAMHSSEDLAETIGVFYRELKSLSVIPIRCGVALMDKETRVAELTTMNTTEQGDSIEVIGKIKMAGHPVLDGVFENWLVQKEYHAVLRGNQIKEYYKVLKPQISYPDYSHDDVQFGYYFMFNEGDVYAWTETELPENDLSIYRRFTSVISLTYKRYKDLKQAEAQAREAQIEASLERVRASAMAMHRSDELSNVLAILFEQFDVLKIQPVDVHLDLFDLEKNTFSYRATGKEGKRVIAEQIVDLDSRPEWQALLQKWKNGKPNTVDFSYYPKEVIRELMAFFPDIWAAMPEDAIMSPEDFPDGIFDALGYCKFGYIGFHHHRKATEEEQRILIRFANEFERLYQRFLDLQKAEAQARESQIEASLERVRSKTMAMHNSRDVADTVASMFDELVKLGVETIRCGIGIMYENYQMELWTAKQDTEGKVELMVGEINMKIHPLLTGGYESWKNKKNGFSYELKDDDCVAYFNAINNYPGYPAKYDIASLPSQIFHYEFHFAEGTLFAFCINLLSVEASQIFKRFAALFGQTYRRYLDLQKAESQAREAQIEASLERVRSKTMAMHSSEDVSAATATMFTELEKLGIENLRGGITIIKPDQTQEVWSVTNLPDGKTIRAIGVFDMRLHPFWQEIFKAFEKNEDYQYYWLAGKDKEDYIAILNATPDYLAQPIKEFPDVHVQSYFFGEGGVWTNSLQPHSEEEKQLMKRFASVFSLTFRRYQDLKKAEAQAREATIEAALERVRGKAMAMHSSKDLASTIGIFYHELESLDLTPRRCGIGLINKETKRAEISTMNASADGEGIELIGNLDLRTHPVLTGVYNNWLTKTEYHPVLRGNEIKEYYQIVRPQIDFPDYPNDTVQYGYFFFFEEGGVYAWTEKELTEEELKIYRRFTSVLSLTYKRYKDLKDAEARTQAAIKDAALDRIRADIASMRTINDLDRITPLIWNELTVLGIPFIRCGVFIMDEEQQLIHTFLSTPDGKAIAAFHLPYDTPGNISKVIDGWRHKTIYLDHWGEEEFVQFADILMKQGALNSREQYLKTIPHGGFYLHFLPFLQGMLYVGNTTQLDQEEIELIQHVADAFSTAYARYEDFNKLEAAKQQVDKTLTDLKQAQQQLVQSEKMASLGELTAGIAHEIQNPLNFVNNFSDVSNELLEEMKIELEKGNKEDAIAIAEDVKQNLEKILHHGKRADAIVKGMLQHSRTSSGQKEPTDINNLADEYLRLAFHGLRAKDKSFNAKFETEFDNSIEKINIIPQDIGRVILNLINNAFYAVTEKKKVNTNGYEPVVTVTTKKDNSKIEIKVKDNGNGIPQKNLDRIFQPFFTTKPTGQGTGLGLSLAYDIVTKGHGGELKVETKEGEGSEFVIQLPMS